MSSLKETLKRVIQLDKESQAKIKALETEKKHISDYRKAIQKELTKSYQEATDKRFVEIQKRILKEFEDGKSTADKDALKKEKYILSQYEKNKETWLESLISFCLRE